MNPRIVMGASALILGLGGVAASFFPHEILRLAGEIDSGFLPLILQLLGALYFAFAMLNWMAKDSLIGGIYNRPVAIGNFVHFLVGALALARPALRAPFQSMVVVPAIVYTLFAVAFGYVFFTSPVKPGSVPANRTDV